MDRWTLASACSTSTTSDAVRAPSPAKDARFDGWFFTAVRTTGIYCRPSCPARTPLVGNVEFHPTSAGAQAAGFRACRRCRPDAVPGSPEWDVRADVVARAMRLIADGEVERSGVAGLAATLGYSERQLHRLVVGELGVGPLALARAQRAQTARVLMETTDLPVADIAFAAGFASIRQFNDAVREVFATTPSALRGSRQPAGGPSGWLTLRLAARAPFCAAEVLLFLAGHAVAGLEEWDGETFSRVLDLPHGPAVVRLSPSPDGAAVTARLLLTELRDLGVAVARCRHLLDLDADPLAVDGALATDPALAGLVRSAPGRRVPTHPDAAEAAVRAVLGQHVSPAAARTFTARLLAAAGTPLTEPVGTLTHVPPARGPGGRRPRRRRAHRQPPAHRARPGRAARRRRGGPGSRRRPGRRAADCSPSAGIGPWTVALVALRGLGDPDAFPEGDLGVRSAARALGLPATPVALHPARHALAAVARVRRATPVGHRHPSDQLPARRRRRLTPSRRHARKDHQMPTTHGEAATRAHALVDSPIGPLTLVADAGAPGVPLHARPPARPRRAHLRAGRPRAGPGG